MSHATSRSIGENAAESRASRPLQVAEAIKEFVVSNALQPGDKLPNEAELMTLFGMAKAPSARRCAFWKPRDLSKPEQGRVGDVLSMKSRKPEHGRFLPTISISGT